MNVSVAVPGWDGMGGGAGAQSQPVMRRLPRCLPPPKGSLPKNGMLERSMSTLIAPSRVADRDLGSTVVIRMDATIQVAHSDKQLAAGTFKGTWGHHSLTAWCP